ncbi:MAG: hypothetical protein ACQEXJ_18880 [Myxococcota bacterium]
MQPPTDDPQATARLEERFDAALTAMEEAPPFAWPNHQPEILDLALRLLKRVDGVPALHRHAPRFDRAGVFHGGDWEHPAHLMPRLVTASLRARGHLLAVEVLSELRFLAILEGRVDHPEVTPERAREFLEDVLAFNLDLLFPEASEASRSEAGPLMDGVQRLFGFLADHLGSEGILDSIMHEAERVLNQRPILVRRVQAIVETAARTVAVEGDTELDHRARMLIAALHGPSELSRELEDPAEYEAAIRDLDQEGLLREAEAMGDSMWVHGLVCSRHVPLLRLLAESHPALLPRALGLGVVGRASLELHRWLVRRLVDEAIHVPTAQAIYGLSSLLECGILFFPPVPPGLRRLRALPILPEVDEALHEVTPGGESLSANAILLAGAFSVLGQPLGVGQGDNPSCQSARAISLWAQVDPGYLLELVAQAARDGEIVMHFEGRAIPSRGVGPGEIRELHPELDPVSRVLVPHLDRVYGEMSRAVVGRGEDGHRWINPELHGWWVHRGFATCVDFATGAVSGLDEFVRLFYATHHPQYRGAAEMLYPQPAGVASTNLWGEFVGWHAVAIDRAEFDPDGDVRVYFFNPNNDSGQRWGQGIVTATSGHGEHPGESSLPFEQFLARLYVFHFDDRETGDPANVPFEPVARVRALVAESWGAHKAWLD